MIGYYLATNKRSQVDGVVWVDGLGVKCMGVGDKIIMSELGDWYDFRGPLNYDTVPETLAVSDEVLRH